MAGVGLIILILLLLLVFGLVLATVGSLSASGPMRRMAGGILLAIGILIMTGSGLCSFAVILSVLGNGDLGLLLMMLLVGGLPFAGGFALAWRGRVLIRRAQETSEEELRRRFD